MKFGLFSRSTAGLALVSMLAAGRAVAAEPTPGLPPDEIVARVLHANPSVQAAASQIRVEEANRDRLEAGQYEWNARFGGQQRKSSPSGGPDQRFNEWNAALERPLRLPGKGALDGELGAAGIALAEAAHGDARHEASRSLLKAWFVWLKESAADAQWSEQVDLLRQQAQAVRRRLQLGDAAKLEAIQGEAALAQAEAQQAQARVRREIAGEDLRRRFPGLPPVAPATIADPRPVQGNAGEWLEIMLEHSHELAMARHATQRARIAPGSRPAAPAKTACPTRPSACRSAANGAARKTSSAPTSAFRSPAAPAAPAPGPPWPRPRQAAGARRRYCKKSRPKPPASTIRPTPP